MQFRFIPQIPYLKAICTIAFFAFSTLYGQQTLRELRNEFPRTNRYTTEEWIAFNQLASTELKRTKSKTDSVYYLKEAADFYIQQGEYPQARNALNRTILIAEELDDSLVLAKSQAYLGNFLILLNDHKNAAHYMHQAKNWFQSQPWNIETIFFYSSLASFYEANNQLDSAISTSKMVLKKCKADSILAKRPEVGSNYNFLTLAYFKLGQYDSTLHYATAFYNICKAKNDIRLMTDAANNMAVYYSVVEQNDEEALKYLNESLAAHTANQSDEDIAKVLLNLSYTYSYLGDYEKAFVLLDSSMILSDSIQQAKRTEEIIRLEREFNYERESQEKILAQQDAEESKLYMQVFALLAVIIGLAGFLSISLYRLKLQQRKKELELKDSRINALLKATEVESLTAELEGQQGERERIAQELHDRLGSLLAGTKMQFTAFADQANNPAKQQQIEELLQEAMAEVRNVSHNLYNTNLLNDGLKASIKRMCKTVQHEGFKVEFTADEHIQPLTDELKSTTYKIFQETVANTLKHANATQFNVSLTNYQSKLVLTLQDNGIGFDENKINHGLGLKNMKQRAAEIQADLTIQSKPGVGTTTTLTIAL